MPKHENKTIKVYISTGMPFQDKEKVTCDVPSISYLYNSLSSTVSEYFPTLEVFTGYLKTLLSEPDEETIESVIRGLLDEAHDETEDDVFFETIAGIYVQYLTYEIRNNRQ